MATRWGWITLMVLLVATWSGCETGRELLVDAGMLADGQDGASADAGSADAGSADAGGDARSTPMGDDAGSDLIEGGVDGGRGGAGGMSGMGGAGASTVVGQGNGATVVTVPAAWTCSCSAYGDGTCDCGCGAPDVDCDEQDLAHCEVCDGPGSCSLAECPGRVDLDDVMSCVPPPDAWTCIPSSYGDGEVCDCGCGTQDEDCSDMDVASCDECATEGSCANGPCPSALATDDNAHCEIPPRWMCEASLYGDGTCHCGCGVVDVDCPDASDASCQECDRSSCSPFGCTVEPDDNAHCPTPPPLWRCSTRLYHDGGRCDCGCGAADPDCASLGVDACDQCDAPGSCSAQPCPSSINAESNDHCEQPTPPPEWTCTAAAYADGLECDCGCGVADPDCRDDAFETCVRCLSCGGRGVCAGTVDPADTTQCAPPPSDWICSTEHYRDSICDCGCGILDSYCQNIELLYVCGNYPIEGCSAGHRAHINPNRNSVCIISVPSEWTCDRSYYDDGVCDCGCGVVDLDCESDTVTDCEECDGDGSCSTAECPGTIATNDAAHCSN